MESTATVEDAGGLVRAWSRTLVPGLRSALALLVLALLALLPRVRRTAALLRHQRRLAVSIPGPPGLPLIGNCHQFFGTPSEVFQKALKVFSQYTPVMRVWFGPKLYVFVWDPDDVQTVLTSPATRDHSPEYDFFLPWLGDGIFCSNGPKWEQHRRLIVPTFNYAILREFLPVFNRCAQELVMRLRRELPSDAAGSATGASQPFDIFDYVTLCTLDIILETAMGVSLNNQRNDNPHFVRATKQMCDVVHQRHYKLWLRSDLVFRLSPLGRVQRNAVRVLHGTSRMILRKRREALKEGKTGNQSDSSQQNGSRPRIEEDIALKMEDIDVGMKQRRTFLDMLLEQAQQAKEGAPPEAQLSLHDVKEEVDSIMFGGHETTAATFSYLMIILGFYPEIQERLVAELDEIFEGSDRPAEFADLLRMKYLERCLKETMRLYSIVPILGRRVAQDLPLKRCVVPRGCTVVMVSYLLHRSPELFPRPEHFDPDRFLPEEINSRHPFAYIPFSAGPRNCIGQKFAMLQMKVTVSTVLRQFRMLPVGPKRDLSLVAELVSKPVGGFTVRFEPRPPRPQLRPHAPPAE